ncbi:MAG: transketolase C-terminal domain-containing protein [Candidatus Binatia bacterium]|jgi:pyruvate/2-oxoglutarate/acetoin dehydrogenase E1 component|nr:transketolase C-terminal domain-containing protein [Candidatus Binatia bacterium]
MREMAYYEAKLMALREILAGDEGVHLFGGTFMSLSPRRAQFREIQKSYPDRIASPPISELGYCGLAIGAAMAGLRPVVDLSTGSFIFEAWPQVVNEAANAFYMSGGQTRAPVVFHLFHGLRGGGGSQHSHSPQAMLWNCPGLEIVLPSSPRDVRGLLRTAVSTNNPTIFVDHTYLLEMRGDVPEEEESIPFGIAEIKRAGRDVTVVATSLMVQRSLAVADSLATSEGIDVEVVDPRTLVPLDFPTIMASIEKTGRLVIVDECHQSCGVAAELAARVAESGFDKLKAPIRRVATLDVPVPYSEPLEKFVSPSEARIVEAIRAVLKAR